MTTREDLWTYFNRNHSLTLLESELDEILHTVNSAREMEIQRLSIERTRLEGSAVEHVRRVAKERDDALAELDRQDAVIRDKQHTIELAMRVNEHLQSRLALYIEGKCACTPTATGQHFPGCPHRTGQPITPSVQES